VTARSRWSQFLDALTHSGPSYQPAVQPRRGDQVEQWLKAQRNDCPERTDSWNLLDHVLDTYRLHADTRTPLGQHVCEGGNFDDCAGCHQEEKKR
jgi:hypothetical protein